jgi:hypothetical protein
MFPSQAGQKEKKTSSPSKSSTKGKEVAPRTIKKPIRIVVRGPSSDVEEESEDEEEESAEEGSVQHVGRRRRAVDDSDEEDSVPERKRARRSPRAAQPLFLPQDVQEELADTRRTVGALKGRVSALEDELAGKDMELVGARNDLMVSERQVGALEGEVRALQATIAAKNALLIQAQGSAQTAATREGELQQRIQELTRVDGELSAKIAAMGQAGGELAPLREVRERLLLWYYSLTDNLGDILRADSIYASPGDIEAVWKMMRRLRSQLSNELSRLNERLGEDSPENF